MKRVINHLAFLKTNVHFMCFVFTHCEQCWHYVGLTMLYLVWIDVFDFTRLVASILFTMTKTSKISFFFVPPKDGQYQKCMKMSDCEMLKMNSYIDIKCCSDDLCNSFDESAWWPPGNTVHWSPVVALQPTWAADEWRSTFNEDKPALRKIGLIKQLKKELSVFYECIVIV